jgi:hypothetical protein
MTIEFVTLPDELQSLANQLFDELRRRGYQPRSEPRLLDLPATPTLLAVRGHETHYYLVRQTVAPQEIQQWYRYCCSCATETRLTVCRPAKAQVSKAHSAILRDNGIGLAFFDATGLQHDLQGRDLAFHARPPDRAQLKPRVRQLLGEALDRLDRGDWRPAFEDACGILEEECRSYLLKNLKMGRVKYQAGGKTKTPTLIQIRKMPMGALKDVFCKLINQNQLEANLCTVLTKLNPDRIRRAHHRKSKRAEASLRQRAGKHFWLISNALALLV